MIAQIVEIFVLFFSLPLVSCIPQDLEYAVLVDAGSSKSQLYVFSYLPTKLPEFKQETGLNLKPGIAGFYNNISQLEVYVKKLVNDAETRVPTSKIAKTSFYMMSTAGMRLLMENQTNTVVSHINKLLSNSSINPFLYDSSENTRILSGEEEGVFAWIAANYHEKKLKGKIEKTVGILEMGGASTQIAFATEDSILANKFPVTIAGQTFPLYAFSHLKYGQDAMLERLKKYLVDNTTENTVNHPCMVKGDTQTANEKTFVGVGDSMACRKLIEVFVSKPLQAWRCSPEPCSIGSAYQPTLPKSMVFHLVGAFRYTLQRIKIENTKTLLPTLKEKTDEFCALTLDEVNVKYPLNIPAYYSLPCMLGNYMQLLFHEAYGFPFNSDKLVVDDKSEWTLGAMVYFHQKTCKSSGSGVATSSITLLVVAILSMYCNN